MLDFIVRFYLSSKFLNIADLWTFLLLNLKRHLTLHISKEIPDCPLKCKSNVNVPLSVTEYPDFYIYQSENWDLSFPLTSPTPPYPIYHQILPMLPTKQIPNLSISLHFCHHHSINPALQHQPPKSTFLICSQPPPIQRNRLIYWK